MLPINKYKESTQKFHNYLQERIFELLKDLEKVESNMVYKTLYNDLESNKVPSTFLTHEDELSQINDAIKGKIAIIKFFKERDVLDAEQVSIAMDEILRDAEFIKIATSIPESITKETINEKIEKCRSIINGDHYDFEFFKKMLDKSPLSEDERLEVLAYDSYLSTKLVRTEERTLPIEPVVGEHPHPDYLDDKVPFEQTNIYKYLTGEMMEQANGKMNGLKVEILDQLKKEEETEEHREAAAKYAEIVKEINEFINHYFPSLFDGVSAKQKKMYSDVAAAYPLEEIVQYFGDPKEVLKVLLIKLIDAKTLVDVSLNIPPFRLDGFNIVYNEMLKVYKDTMEASKKIMMIEQEDVKEETDVYFLLNGNAPLFDVESLDEESKGELTALISELEQGSFDYERGKRSGNSHTIVHQDVRKDLNAFVNKKRLCSVSYLRVKPDNGDKTKTLVLYFDKTRDVFGHTIDALQKKDILNSAIDYIKSGNPNYVEMQKHYRERLDELIGKRGETL